MDGKMKRDFRDDEPIQQVGGKMSVRCDYGDGCLRCLFPKLPLEERESVPTPGTLEQALHGNADFHFRDSVRLGPDGPRGDGPRSSETDAKLPLSAYR